MINNLDKQIEEKKKELELLELKKKEAELKLEIEKISKTKIEETIIVHREIHQWQYNPLYKWNQQPNLYTDKFYCQQTQIINDYNQLISN